MSYKTRKHIWPVSLTTALGIVVMLAMMAAVVWTPGPAMAQGDAPPNPFGSPPPAGGNDGDGDAPPNPFGDAPPTPPVNDMIASSSTSGGASVKLTLTLSNPGALNAGSSVALYLEDDFQVGDIDESRVYFIGKNTGRVYVTDDVVVDDDDHFGGDDDWDIQVFVPDMNPGNDTGYDSWTAADAMGLKLVFDKAGVNNPTEAGSHSVGYSVLGPDASVGDPQVTLDGMTDSGAPLITKAKISLSDEDAGRGKEVTVTGSGFNNGTGAEVRVLVSATDLTEGDQAANCQNVMLNGEKLGETAVGSDDKFTVTFTVHQDEFDAGAVNYICAADAESGNPRFASEVKVFELEPSVTVSPRVGQLRRRNHPEAPGLRRQPDADQPRPQPRLELRRLLPRGCHLRLHSRKGRQRLRLRPARRPGRADSDCGQGAGAGQHPQDHDLGCGSVRPQVEQDGSRAQRERDHLRQRIHQERQDPGERHHHRRRGVGSGRRWHRGHRRQPARPHHQQRPVHRHRPHLDRRLHRRLTPPWTTTSTPSRWWTRATSRARPRSPINAATGHRCPPETVSPRDFIVISGENWPVSTSDVRQLGDDRG